MLSLPDAIKSEIEKTGQQLTIMTHARIVEQAAQKLHSRREMYIEALHHSQVNEHTFLITLDGEARWIEEGVSEHNMLLDLLASPKAKTAKDGSKYLAIPFKHNVGPSVATPAQANIVATIKQELKKSRIPFGKIEKDKETGQPKLGMLHSINFPSPLQNFPILKGAKIYQHKVKDKKGNDHVQRSIMTFRIASSKHVESADKWDHPGTAPMNFMNEASDWAQQQWDNLIAPSLVKYIEARL